MRALVLSGGGVKGAYQIGALHRLLIDEQRDYDILCGVSVGAINVAGLAHTIGSDMVPSYYRLKDVWTSIEHTSILRPWKWFGRLAALWKQSAFDSSPMCELIDKSIDQDIIKSSSKIVSVGAVCVDDGTEFYCDGQNEHFKDFVKASASFPIYFPPVEIEGKHWVDGGLRSVTPIVRAIELGATEIDVIMCSNPDEKLDTIAKKSIVGLTIRTVEIMIDQIMRHDIQKIQLMNKLAKYEPNIQRIKIRLVSPVEKLVDASLVFEHDTIMELIERGYQDAINQLG